MNNFKNIVVVSLCLSVLLTGCGAKNAGETTTVNDLSQNKLASIKVTRQNITPIFSVKNPIVQSPRYVVLLSERGSFKGIVKPGMKIKSGTVFGWANGIELKAPVDSRVVSVADESADLPANYSIAEFEYRGFGIHAAAAPLLNETNGNDITGKFQVIGGVGPTDCLAVVRSADAALTGTQVAEGANAKSDIENENVTSEDNFKTVAEPNEASNNALCLVNKKDAVLAGQTVNLVLAGVVKENVLVLPVNAIAGRTTAGAVYVLKNGKPEIAKVELGATDGAKIEIISGLAEGDEVLPVPPNLDPRVSN